MAWSSEGSPRVYIPRTPWSLAVSREGYGYEFEPSCDVYLLYCSERDRIGFMSRVKTL